MTPETITEGLYALEDFAEGYRQLARALRSLRDQASLQLWRVPHEDAYGLESALQDADETLKIWGPEVVTPDVLGRG